MDSFGHVLYDMYRNNMLKWGVALVTWEELSPEAKKVWEDTGAEYLNWVRS